MTAKFQLVIDCADPEPLVRFWVAAFGYEFEPPPDGYDNWDDYWRAVGVSEDELGLGLDRIVDPAGRGASCQDTRRGLPGAAWPSSTAPR
jgi:Glyoxalase-like domain